jgi:hypothetical protein
VGVQAGFAVNRKCWNSRLLQWNRACGSVLSIVLSYSCDVV